jgi:hypothetical protein
VPVDLVGQPSQRAQNDAQAGSFLVRAQKQLDASLRRAAGFDVGSRQDHLIPAREVALYQLAGGTVACDPGIEPPKQEPRQGTRQLG